MANVLPVQDRVSLRRNYWLRLVVTFTFVMTAAMTIGIVSLIPAYLSGRAELNEAMRYQQLQEETREVAKQDTAVQTARLVNTQVEELLKSERTSATLAISHIMRNWEVYAEDIIISGFSFALVEGKEMTPELRVSGEARDRTALNSFVQTLRTDSTFRKVSFPVSDLAGEGTVDFSLVVQFKS